MNIVNLHAFTNSARVPTVVLLDLQQEYLATSRLMALSEAPRALERCRRVLEHARRVGLPIAYGRLLGRNGYFNAATHLSRWIEGFEPTASDIVFERNQPSCYSSKTFAEAMGAGGGQFVLAGFAGEAACLSTIIDAFHRNHVVTFLSDASASHALDEYSGAEVHNLVAKVAGIYATVADTDGWINATTGNDNQLAPERIS